MTTVFECVFALGDCDYVFIGDSFEFGGIVGASYVFLLGLFSVFLLELGVDAFGTVEEAAGLV